MPGVNIYPRHPESLYLGKQLMVPVSRQVKKVQCKSGWRLQAVWILPSAQKLRSIPRTEQIRPFFCWPRHLVLTAIQKLGQNSRSLWLHM